MRYTLRWQLAVVCLVAASLFLLMPARRGRAQAGVTYTVNDLGTIGTDPKSKAFDIDPCGRVVGGTFSGGTSPDPIHAFIWDSGTMTDLGTLGGSRATANAINSVGVVTGEAESASLSMHTFKWSAGTMTEIVGGNSVGDDINAAGTVVGAFDGSSGNSIGLNGFVWTQATGAQTLPALGGSAGVAYGINAAGDIVGDAQTQSGAFHAFLIPAGGTITDLLTLGGTQSHALRINDSGQAVGYSTLPSNSANVPFHGFVWSSTSTPNMRDIGTLNGTTRSIAYDINNAGQAVGYSEVSAGVSHAFIYTVAGGMLDLNNLLDPATGAGWTLTEARGINDRGQVVGYGTNPSGQTRAFLLTPSNFSPFSNVSGTGVYNGTATLTATLPTCGSPGGGQNVSFTVNGSPVGNATTVVGGVATLSNVAIPGVNAGAHPNAVGASFSGGSSTGTLTVGKADQTITFAPLADKTFGDTDFTVGASASSGLAVGFSAVGQCTVSAGTVHITGGGSCTITASQGGDSNFNAAPDVGRSFTINRASQSITFAPLVGKTFGDADFAVGATASSGLPVSFGASGNCSVSGSTVHITGAGSCTVTASQPGDSNFFAATPVPQSFTISKAVSTTTVSVSNATFDGQPHGGSATVTGSGGLSQSLSVTYTGRNATSYNSTTPPTNAGDYTASASFGGDSNHNSSSDSKDFSIAKASQTITVNTHAPSSAVFNSSFNVAATSDSGLAVAFSNNNSGVCTNNGAAFKMTSGTGTCTVKYDQAGDANHTPATQVTESVTAQKAGQTVTFAPLADKAVGDPDFTVSASASSGLSVSFSASGQCSVTGATVHLAGAGTCTVHASQAGNSNYNAAPDVDQSFTVAKASQTITFNALANRTFGDAPFTVSATGGASGNPVTFAASGNCTSGGTNGSTITITGAGSCTVTASQSGNPNFSDATPVQQTFQIAKASTTTAVFSSANPSSVGQSVDFFVNVTPAAPGTPTGTVTFKDNGSAISACASVALNTGHATCTTNALSVGSHTVTADYSGDSNFKPSSGTLSGGQAVFGGFEFVQGLYTVSERDGSVTVTVHRTDDTSHAASVDYATDDGSTPSVAVPCSSVTGLALERCDYTRAAGTLNFAPGEAQKTFTVLVNDDSYAEGNEVTNLRLSNPVGSTLDQRTSALLQITDDTQQTANPVGDSQFFVRQHYHDFLNREPDTAGLNFWAGQTTGCGNPDLLVCRINVSAAFFLSIEFQQTGYLVERMYKVAYGDAAGGSTFPSPHQLSVPVVRLQEFLRDTQEIGSTPNQVIVGQGNWQQQLEDNKNAFALEFVQRQRFIAAFPATLTADQFVRQLNANAGGVLSDANAGGVLTASDIAQLDSIFGGAAASSADATKRAQVLRSVAENGALSDAEKNRAFVLMQFFGYLRRNPNDAPDSDYTGYDFWLTKLNQFNGDFIQAEMVKAFLSADEYRHRFGQ